MSFQNSQNEKEWIRGVNVGGWLLAERFITPYLFAVNSCHLAGEMCWYPGQIGMPKNATLCDPKNCTPILPLSVMDGKNDFHPRIPKAYNDYPADEYTLGQTFVNRTTARRYMERHWDTFVTYQDLVDLKSAGVTHLRVPMGYWILGDVAAGEPYIPGGWPYFVRFAKWCREVGGLQIWADLHGAPGSENGFDNSGHFLGSSCAQWDEIPDNVDRTVIMVAKIAQAIAEEGLTDVVTGFGLLNEPFYCHLAVLRNYYDRAFKMVRSIMGPDTAVFIGDNFQPWQFNDGWWIDDETHYKTYLDSHPYHVFFEKGRAFTPKQHIAYLCGHNKRETESCCYRDPPVNTVPAKGLSRIVGEWSAAYDSLPSAMNPYVMKEIAATGVAPFLNRTLSKERKNFIRNFVEAQMVVYEAQNRGVSSGWLFWNFKMEGGAFAEWDFLRGIREGWIPKLPNPTVASEDLYGSCLDIYNRTNDEYNLVVDEFPDPRTLDWKQWQGWDADDDLVLNDPSIPRSNYGVQPWHAHMVIAAFIMMMMLIGLRRYYANRKDRIGYEQLK